jgi:hypothetical protein
MLHARHPQRQSGTIAGNALMLITNPCLFRDMAAKPAAHIVVLSRQGSA